MSQRADDREGLIPATAPMQGTVVQVLVAEGDAVHADQPIVLMEAMKMEHVVGAPQAGEVRRLLVAAGETILEGQPLCLLEPREIARPAAAGPSDAGLDEIRPDLEEVLQRHAVGSTRLARTWWRDDGRPDSARPVRTWRTSATRGRSWSTARW